MSSPLWVRSCAPSLCRRSRPREAGRASDSSRCRTERTPAGRGSRRSSSSSTGSRLSTGLQPVVMIEETGSGESTKFLATAGSEPGEYHADVVFPSAGDWRVTILCGFGDSKVTYGPVAIGEPGAGGGGSEPLSVIGFGALALARLGAFGVVAVRRSRRLDSGERLSPREPRRRRRCRNGRWRTGRRAMPCSQNARGAATSTRSESSCARTRASPSARRTCSRARPPTRRRRRRPAS